MQEKRTSNPGRSSGGFVPALGYGFLTSLYDPATALATRERLTKSRLIEQAAIQRGARVLDLGCGTGTLALQLALRFPSLAVRGLDADSRILRRARAKTRKAHVRIPFERGLSEALPYADGAFDRVLSSLFFHHLTRAQKVRTAEEIRRVLRPGGQLHVADWGKPTGTLMRFLFYPVQLLDGFDTTADNVAGLLPEVFEAAGLRDVRTRGAIRTVCGTLVLHSAVRP